MGTFVCNLDRIGVVKLYKRITRRTPCLWVFDDDDAPNRAILLKHFQQVTVVCIVRQAAHKNGGHRVVCCVRVAVLIKFPSLNGFFLTHAERINLLLAARLDFLRKCELFFAGGRWACLKERRQD